MQNTKKMVLVEDSPADAMLVRLAVEETELPLEIIHFSDGDEMLNFMRDVPSPDVQFILLDLNIPKANGFDILKYRQSIEKWQQVPVVLYSSSARREEVAYAFANGTNAYVTKPVDYEQFNRKIKHLAIFWTEMNITPQ